MLPSERRAFVNRHRTCALGCGRDRYGPAMSVECYVPDDRGMVYVFTMVVRAKVKAVARNRMVGLCVLDETWPFAYPRAFRTTHGSRGSLG